MELIETPASKRWVSYTLRKRDQIISKVQHRLVKKSFEYEHEVLNSVKEAYELNKKNNNTRWKNSIAKKLTSFL